VLDGLIQRANINPNDNPLLTFSKWKLAIFGLALILMMRFRPEGLLPADRLEAELHSQDPPEPATAGGI
jgi:branched-chain amino acid transport system permease protein